jgi:hypothetical protein
MTLSMGAISAFPRSAAHRVKVWTNWQLQEETVMPPSRQITRNISALIAARALQLKRSRRFHRLAAQIARQALVARTRKRPRRAEGLLGDAFWYKGIAVRAALRAAGLTRQIRRLRKRHAAALVQARLQRRKAAQRWRRAVRPAMRQSPMRPLQRMAARQAAPAALGRRPFVRQYAQLRPNQPVRCDLIHRAGARARARRRR